MPSIAAQMSVIKLRSGEDEVGGMAEPLGPESELAEGVTKLTAFFLGTDGDLYIIFC